MDNVNFNRICYDMAEAIMLLMAMILAPNLVSWALRSWISLWKE